MTPTREEFKVVAEWLRLPITMFDDRVVAYTDDGWSHKPWQPHLPGIDNQRLMAAMKIDAEWQHEAAVRTCAYLYPAWFTRVTHDNTPDSKLQALASAVWQCAVKVAQEAKKS